MQDAVSNTRSRYNQRSKRVFLTDLLKLAAYLASQGYETTFVETGSTKVLFSFEQTPGLIADVAAFNAGTALVDPAAYDAARISLRRQMDALKGGG